MMTIEPESNDNEMENYKYANTICEILTHDGNLFSNLIATNRKYLLILWSFLDHSCRNEISVLCEQQQQQEQQQSTETEENLSIDKKEESNDENVDKNENEKNEESGDKNENKIEEKETPSNNEDKVEEKSDNQEFETKNDEKQPMTTTTTATKSTNKESLNPLLASFFTKVFAYIFMHDTEPVLEFLITRNHPNDLVTVILKHIQTSAIMDFIYKTWKYINVDRYNQINQLTNEIKETLNGTTIIIKNDNDDDNDKDNDDEQQQQQQESSINLKFNNVSELNCLSYQSLSFMVFFSFEFIYSY